MSQKRKLKNMKLLESHRQVQSIVELILMNVSEAIDIRTASEDIVLDMVEDAMDISDKKVELSITNSISGQKYSVSLERSDMAQLENAGYDIKHIKSGTTQHIYAALRAMLPDIGRSTSIRIWYTNDSGEDVTVPANEMPALRLVGKKLFTMKLWGCPAADSQQGNQQRSGSWTRLWTDENVWIWVWLHEEDGWTNDSFWGWTDEDGWIQFHGYERPAV
jgi:hypothetical protein